MAKVHLFYNGPFSNWYGSEFKMSHPAEAKTTVTYANVEQRMMHYKALLMGDKATAKKIMGTTDPKSIKALGRAVKNYDEGRWGTVRFEVVRDALVAKFGQNRELFKMLMETDGRFAEASPYDKIWGIGMRASEAAKDPANWKGQNLLGKALDEARMILSK